MEDAMSKSTLTRRALVASTAAIPAAAALSLPAVAANPTTSHELVIALAERATGNGKSTRRPLLAGPVERPAVGLRYRISRATRARIAGSNAAESLDGNGRQYLASMSRRQPDNLIDLEPRDPELSGARAERVTQRRVVGRFGENARRRVRHPIE
jgi:hypothetical protein